MRRLSSLALAGLLVVAGAAAASAEPVGLELEYDCGAAGKVQVRVDSVLPDWVSYIRAYYPVVDVEIRGLTIPGARVDGDSAVSLTTRWAGPKGERTVTATMPVAPAAVPGTVRAAGWFPEQGVWDTGDYVIHLDELRLSLAPENADGSSAGARTEVACTHSAADAVLGTLTSENLIYELPLTPSGLTATAVTATSVALEWQSSPWWYETAGHNIYVNGKMVEFVPGKSTTLTGLTPDSQHRIAVATKDVMGIVSERSVPVVVNTPPASFSLALTGKSTLRKGGSIALTGSVKGMSGVTGSSASVALDPAVAKLRLFGLIPATGSLTFTPGPVSIGDRVVVETGVKLTGISIAGVPVSPGPSCATAVKAELVPGPDFSLTTGGPLSGTYALPPFAGCGALTDFVNSAVAGPDNTLDLVAQNR